MIKEFVFFLFACFVSILFGWAFSRPFLFLIPLLLIFLAVLWWRQWQLWRFFNNDNQEIPKYLGKTLLSIVQIAQKRFKKSSERKKRYQEIVSDYNELAQIVPNGIILIDQQGLLLNLNNMAKEWFLLRRSDLGKNINQLIRLEGFAQLIKNQQNGASYTVKLMENGKFIEITKIKYSQNRWLLLAHDISKMILLDQKRKSFIDNASHELKTPLTVLNGFLELIKSNPENWQEAIAEMTHQTQKMTNLVNDILALANLERDDHLLQENIIDLPKLIINIRRDLSNAFGKPITINITQDGMYWLRADENLLFSAIYNLIHNALIHSKSKNPVKLIIFADISWLYIQVQDDGIGIASVHLDRITERFYWVDKNQGKKGSGLGLSIVKHAIEAHGGQLQIRSREGEGSLFQLKLPKDRLVGNN